MKFLNYLIEDLSDPNKKYQAAIKFIKSRLKKLLGISSDPFRFYTWATAPKSIKKQALKVFGFNHPAYIDMKTFSIIIEPSKMITIDLLIHAIAHEIGHALVYWPEFMEKLKNIKLHYSLDKAKYGNLKMISALEYDENLADMFSHYLSGKSLNDKEKLVMNQLGINI